VARELIGLYADQHCVAEFGEGFVLDLADAFAGETDLGADFF
jgi:hypothetical protein